MGFVESRKPRNVQSEARKKGSPPRLRACRRQAWARRGKVQFRGWARYCQIVRAGRRSPLGIGRDPKHDGLLFNPGIRLVRQWRESVRGALQARSGGILGRILPDARRKDPGDGNETTLGP